MVSVLVDLVLEWGDFFHAESVSVSQIAQVTRTFPAKQKITYTPENCTSDKHQIYSSIYIYVASLLGPTQLSVACSLCTGRTWELG